MNQSIGSLMRSFAPNVALGKLCDWPPDVFAIAGSLLQVSGAYRFAVTTSGWRRLSKSGHAQELETIGAKWRERAGKNLSAPVAVAAWWRRLTANERIPVSEIPKREDLRHALFDLIGAADEACKGAGLPTPYSREHPFLERAAKLLLNCLEQEKPSTLCEKVRGSAVCVLPKRHTPQVGISFRSLTHYLALCRVDEASPFWIKGVTSTAHDTKVGDALRLLLIPRPECIDPSQFSIIQDEHCGRTRFADDHRFFSYKSKDNEKWIEQRFPEILRKAEKVDGVIFPELSLASQDELLKTYDALSEIYPSAFLLSGVGQQAKQAGVPTQNAAQYMMPVDETAATLVTQFKHHRWKMDGSQVKQYDLGQSLDTGLSLWEHIDIPDRQLHFFAAKRWLTFCFLVCEDLARQDPVTKLVRAVGPDLVIALLMDGPQISQRWPARYAAVLAEDPGCSVLTLTNLGMVDRSRRNGPQAPSHACPNCKHSWTEPEKKSRAVALWRDRTQGNVEIELEAGAEAIVLTLTRKKETEYSVDGRRHVDAAHLVLDTKASNHILQIHLANREALL